MRVEVIVEDGTADDEIEILEISTSVGAAVAEGDVLLEVATDKANTDIVAPAAGTVSEVRVTEGDTVSADSVLVVLEVG
jgi:pyruvate/2-oxoglutarate dehydrogenase complex dihydrolipoamide acyltransferase (E2) component